MINRANLRRLLKPWKLPRQLFGAIIGVIVGVLLIVGALTVYYTGRTNNAAVNQKPEGPIAVVQITANGFVPSTLSVSKGTKVVWVNEDTMPHRIAADPYPTHKQLPALLAPKALGNKQTYSFTFTKAKTINYHDELNPTLEWEGTITVK